ncbi:MAG: hypothetical protein K6E20_01715 [Acholeplasmatales bacterium]|nr:hypothetical protein [Acholeplasmatales bacterium]
MEVRIKNLYGFNYVREEEKEFIFSESKRTHFIYGTNASGKSSFSKSIDLIAKGTKFEKILQEDADSYELKLKYDDIDICIDEKSNCDLNQYKERIFVYNKNYIGENLSPNLENQVIEIGSRISELRKLSKDNSKYQDSVLADIQARLKNKLNLSALNAKTLTGKKNITKYVTGREKGKIVLIKEISKTVDDNLFLKIKAHDIANDNISTFKEIDTTLKKITNDAIEKIRLSYGNYNIDSSDDISFYHLVLSELNRKHFDKCPVCLNEPFNQEDIKKKISDLLDEIKKQNEFKLILEKLNSDSMKDSYFGGKYKSIFDEVLKGSIDVDLIAETSDELKKFDGQYDSIILKYIDYDFDEVKYNTFISNNITIKQIVDENSVKHDDKFIDNFNSLLEKLFGNNNKLKAQKMYEEVNGEKFYSIQLIVDGVLKKGVSIIDFFNKVLSESQKARISLAYYFTSILSKNRNEKIICIFDDPLDSYDSNGKYIICRELKDFCEKTNFYEQFNYESLNIILTHSVDFLRTIQLFNVEWKFYVLNSFSLIEICNDDLFVFDGDPNILIKKIGDYKKIDINEMIPLTAILRSICADITKVLCIDNNNKNNIKVGSNNESTQKIQKDLSNKFIHGWFKSDRFTIADYRDYLKLKCNIELEHINPTDLTKDIFTYMKEYIELNKGLSLTFIKKIFFKNYLSLYIRSFADGRLAQEIARYCLKRDGSHYSNAEEVSNEILQIAQKMRTLERNILNVPAGADRDRVIKLIDFVCSNRVLLNDFAHSENAFISPVIDVKEEDLLDLYNKVGLL